MKRTNEAKALDSLIEKEIGDLSDADALGHIAALIDAAHDSRSHVGTQRAFALLDSIQERTLSDADGVLVHYLRANAWENRRQERDDYDVWAWEQPEIQAQILELRRAMRHAGFSELPAIRQCQIVTNLANQLSQIGRFIEAIALWDNVLKIDERIAMAHGNRGLALCSYARSLYDPGQAGLIYAAAFDSLHAATSAEAFYDSAGLEPIRARFEKQLEALGEHLNIETLRQAVDVRNHSMGDSAEERAYRTWCLKERQFINPLNDLGNVQIAAQDVLTLPSLTVPAVSSGIPPVIGFFNQMKQEFVSARYLFYEGLRGEEPHFSDRDVLLYNTLDYPAYSLAVEKMRAAFRITYSLFDKIGYFLNSYLDIGRNPTQVSFRTIWYEPRGKNPALLARFAAGKNWPLRGLFWLSKDLFEEELQRVTEPDAEALATIRNHIEHKYLQLHDGWAGSHLVSGVDDLESERLSYALSCEDFAARTLRLLQLARGALIYLSLAVHREEAVRMQTGSGVTVPMPLTRLEDDWKS